MGNRRLLFTLLLSSLLLIGCGQEPTAESLMPVENLSCSGQYIKEKYLVKFRSGEIRSYYFTNREQFKSQIVEPNLSLIEYIEYDQRFEFSPRENGVFSGSMIDNYGLVRINAAAAWQKGVRGQGVTVAVVDSGVDISHPQLSQQIAYNQGEMGLDSKGLNKSLNGVDDDGNGYVDDYAGYDFIENSGQMVDTVSHGTHVAGIIAAQHNLDFVSNSQVQGLAPQAKILPVRFLGNGGGTLEGALNSLDYARKRGVQIINASWGGSGCSQALQDKVREITSAGIIFVAAAGNSGASLDQFPEFPAAFRFPLQITVGSSGTRDGMSSFSNYSRALVDLFAPGFNIFSTLPQNRVGAQSGTSMAAPYVAAAAALLYSANPNAAPENVVNALLNSVDVNVEFLNRSQGRLNVARALEIMAQ